MTAVEVFKRGDATLARNDPPAPAVPPLEEPAQLTLFPMHADVTYAVHPKLGIACPCASPAIAAQLNEFFSR